MRRLLLSFAVLWATSLCLFAQNEQSEINNIKRSPDYLFATGSSMQNAEEATANARELLSLEIEQWLKENAKGDYTGYIAKSKQNVAEIKTRRGNLNRTFVYVKKTNILTYSDGESVLVVNTKTDESVPQQMDTIQIVQAEPVPVLQTKFDPNPQERDMLKVRNFSEINEYLLARKGKEVSSYGKYQNDTRILGQAYVYVFDRDKVLAVLRLNGSSAVNLSTGLEDSVANYGRSGAIWFQLSSQQTNK